MKYSNKKEHKRHSDFMNALLFPGFLAGVVNGGYMESVVNEEEFPIMEDDEETTENETADQ
jgi:hypothetical protein